MIKLIIDTAGGDNSPAAPVEAAVQALKKNEELYIIFTGNEADIRSELAKYDPVDTDRYEIVHAPDVITGDDKPTEAIRLKPESSMMKGIKLLRTGEDIDGMVSTGATGALVAAATVRIGRIPGVIRPVFCPIIPDVNGGVCGISDSGANIKCTPDQLLQFAAMGKLYLKAVFGIDNPRIALLNIGTEAEKGDSVHKDAYKLLSKVYGDSFVGNMEGRDLLSGNYQLIIADGFSGNILVKTMEGTALELMKLLKKKIYSKTRYKVGAMLMKSMFDEIKGFMNYQNYGGSVLLGTEKIIVKGHGSSNALSIEKCIEQALTMRRYNLNAQIEQEIAGIQEYMGVYTGEDHTSI
ncbi:MAG: phosphate acyltransferase PlsX [Clostridia bacterium]|nr:phosphate acyltransferase PlsX [Clostridia bacterium]